MSIFDGIGKGVKVKVSKYLKKIKYKIRPQ